MFVFSHQATILIAEDRRFVLSHQATIEQQIRATQRRAAARYAAAEKNLCETIDDAAAAAQQMTEDRIQDTTDFSTVVHQIMELEQQVQVAPSVPSPESKVSFPTMLGCVVGN